MVSVLMVPNMKSLIIMGMTSQITYVNNNTYRSYHETWVPLRWNPGVATSFYCEVQAVLRGVEAS